MWSNLPSNLRTILGTALVLGIGVAGAAFALSFFALRSAAENPELKFGQGHAWLFPIGIDMALIFFEVLLLGASMVFIWDERQRKAVQYPRAIPFLLVMVAAAGSLYFNATRVPDKNGLRLIALAVPVASILVTLGLAYLIKMLTIASGGTYQYEAPEAAYEQITPRARKARSETTVHRIFQTGQNGHAISGNGQSKKQLVEAYLDEVEPSDLRRITAREIAQDLTDQGHPMTSQTVTPVLRDYRKAHGVRSLPGRK